MIALGEEKLDDELALRAERWRVGVDDHALQGFGNAGGCELGLAFDFDEAEAAGAGA